MVAISASVFAKTEADFVKGIFATENGCKQLKALSEGKAERSIKTVPEVLTREGFDGWEFSCEFTRIDQHNSSTWIGLMLCQEGAKIGVSNFVFSKRDDGVIEVFTPGEEQPDVFRLCAIEDSGAAPAGTPSKTEPDQKTPDAAKPDAPKAGDQ